MRQSADMTVFWRSILILAILFFLLYLTLNALRNNLSYRSFAKAAGPTNIILTDVAQNEAGVVYHTETAEPTLVKYQVGGQDLIATDILGTRPLKNHFSRLVSLPPGTTIPIDISGQKITLKTLPAGQYKALQAKIVSGVIPSQTPKDWTDTVVVLQTNDKYFATRADNTGEWLISWVNNLMPDATVEIVGPIYDANVIIYPADANIYQFPVSWNSIKTITASIVTPKVPKVPALTFWEQVRKFFLTFLPNFSLLTSNS